MFVSPRNIDLRIKAPPSKSETMRSLLIAMLANFPISISNLSNCDDAKYALKILSFRKIFTKEGRNLSTIENISSSTNRYHCGESAFLVRAIAAQSAFSADKIILNGRATILNRNFEDIAAFCNLHDIDFASDNFRLPIELSSKHIISDIRIDASSSSQLLSGLLIANAFQETPKTIIAQNIVSKGYIDLTIDMLSKIGIDYAVNDDVFSIIKKSSIEHKSIDISGDWSGAAFFLVAAAIAGRVQLKGLDLDSKQPDRLILEVLTKAGANLSYEKQGSSDVIICEKSELTAFSFDATDNPDLVPPLAVLAVSCKGQSEIKGVSRLKNKESNRLEALRNEFASLGADIHYNDDTLFVNGGSIKGGKASSHADHRIAMALAILALRSGNGIIIDDTSVISKSYPRFLNELRIE